MWNRPGVGVKPYSQIVDSSWLCHVGWNWLLWAPRQTDFSVNFFCHFPPSPGLLPFLKENWDVARVSWHPDIPGRPAQTTYVKGSGGRRGGVGARPRMTEELFMCLVGFPITSYRPCTRNTSIPDNERTPVATAASKCRVDATDTAGKWMPFQPPRKEMHRKFVPFLRSLLSHLGGS